MRRSLLLILFVTNALVAADEPQKLTIALEPLGDSDAGVVARVTFKFAVGSDIPEGVPLVVIGSTAQGQTVKPFRYPLLPAQRNSLSAIQTLQPGDAEIEARLMVPLEEQAPVIVAKNTAHFTIAKTNKPYVASASDGAEAIIAEGSVPVMG